MSADRTIVVIDLPAPWSLQGVFGFPLSLHRDGERMVSLETFIPGAIGSVMTAENTQEVRDFAAAMCALAEDPWRPIDDDAPRDGSGFMAFGRHTTDNGRHWHAGDFWWGIILWNIWTGDEPSWVFAKDGRPTWSTPSHYQRLTPPRTVLASIDAAERGDAPSADREAAHG